MSAPVTRSLPYDPATVEFDPLLRRLNLANTRRRWRELLDRAETQGWSCREFLGVLITEEIAHRQQTRLQRSVSQAHFPFLKTVDEFDFSLQSSLRLPFLGSYLGPEFTARFVSAASLIETLSVASRQGRLQEALANYLQPHVLVVDEVGYLSYGPDAANVLFHVVNERHLRPGRCCSPPTSHRSPPGDVLHDHDLAEAIVDRVLERGRLLLLDGPSYRTQHLDLPDQRAHDALNPPARISGKHPADFPEPTLVIVGISSVVVVAAAHVVMTGEAQRLLLLLLLQAQLQHVLNAAVGAQSVGQRPPAGAIEPRCAVALLQAQDAQAGTKPLRRVLGVP